MKKIFLLFALIVSTLYASRNRHVATEWNTDSICLEDDIGKLINEGGWYFSPWLHAYYQTTDWWIYHCDKGWLFPESDGNKGVWLFWERSESWVWTRDDVYPLAYDTGSNVWFNFCVKPEPVAQLVVRHVIAPN